MAESNTRARDVGYDNNCVRVTLLHNPNAGRAEYVKKKLKGALRNAGHEVTYYSTRKRGWKKVLANSKDLVVVAGGDGTVGKVAHRLIGRPRPLAILPTGTANNLARSLGVTESVQELIDQLHLGKPAGFDVGVARGPWGERHFFEAMGAGLLAEYLSMPRREVHDLSREEEMIWHVVCLRKLLRHYRPRRWTLTVDGRKKSGRFLMLEAMNVCSVGPALQLAPNAQTGDGRFELILVEEGDRAKLMSYFGQRLQSKHTAPMRLPVLRFQNLKVDCGQTPFHIDSELWPNKGDELPQRSTKVEIELKNSALMILRPGKS